MQSDQGSAPSCATLGGTGIRIAVLGCGHTLHAREGVGCYHCTLLLWRLVLVPGGLLGSAGSKLLVISARRLLVSAGMLLVGAGRWLLMIAAGRWLLVGAGRWLAGGGRRRVGGGRRLVGARRRLVGASAGASGLLVPEGGGRRRVGTIM